MNLFDRLQTNLFKVVTDTMGYDAIWKADGDYSLIDYTNLAQYTDTLAIGRVLYKGPTEKEQMGSVDYDVDKITMEYKLGDFDQLEISADNNVRETVRILDVAGQWMDVTVLSVQRKLDGKTLQARINIKAFGPM